MTFPAIVVVGASAGGVAPLLEMAATLPADFPAPVCIALHVGCQPSILPELLGRRGQLPARHASDGESLNAGVIYIAPPDHHLLLDARRLHLSRGPKENHARPAIDPLFRTAALHWRERAVGVVLSGALDDGAAGLAAIKASGGVAVVQDPASALEASMPRSAMAAAVVDFCVPPQQLGPLLTGLATPAAGRAQGTVPQQVKQEHGLFEGALGMDELDRIGTPSSLTCPDCGGGMWEIRDTRPLRYRCHTGHAFSALSLRAAQEEASEQEQQSWLRSLQERQMLLRRMADIAEATGDAAQAAAGRREADRLHAQAQALRGLIVEG